MKSEQNLLAERQLDLSRKMFLQYKNLGEKAMSQLDEELLFFQPNEDSNSVASLVKHLWGNMLSRWTDFLNSDGEKEWRERDAEFVNDLQSRAEMMEKWNEGWSVLFKALEELKAEDWEKIVYIRKEAHWVGEAVQRQLMHYSYHVGQIVYLCKLLKKGNWDSLSIPRKK